MIGKYLRTRAVLKKKILGTTDPDDPDAQTVKVMKALSEGAPSSTLLFAAPAFLIILSSSRHFSLGS